MICLEVWIATLTYLTIWGNPFLPEVKSSKDLLYWNLLTPLNKHVQHPRHPGFVSLISSFKNSVKCHGCHVLKRDRQMDSHQDCDVGGTRSDTVPTGSDSVTTDQLNKQIGLNFMVLYFILNLYITLKSNMKGQREAHGWCSTPYVQV